EPPGGSLFSGTGADEQAALPQIDDGSRLVAELAAAARPPDATKPRVWDACAAPGGKTLVLAARLPEADILATDISPRRLSAMQRRLQQYTHAGRIQTEVLDASTHGISPDLFDLILCDVPCSGTGTLARNPEIRLRLELGDLPRQSARQRAILLNAVKRLALGGRLVY